MISHFIFSHFIPCLCKNQHNFNPNMLTRKIKKTRSICSATLFIGQPHTMNHIDMKVKPNTKTFNLIFHCSGVSFNRGSKNHNEFLSNVHHWDTDIPWNNHTKDKYNKSYIKMKPNQFSLVIPWKAMNAHASMPGKQETLLGQISHRR